jgi:hypothetical protein
LLIGGSTNVTGFTPPITVTGATGNLVTHSGGTINTDLDIRVGDASGDVAYTSTYNLSGTAVINTHVDVTSTELTAGFIGRQGTAVFNQTGGTANWNGILHIGNREAATAGTNGLYEISAGDMNVATNLTIATNGVGQLRVVGDDATIDVGGTFTVGNTANGLGTLAFKVENGDLLSQINVVGAATFASGSALVFDATTATPTQAVYDLLTATSITDSGIAFSQPGTSGWTYQIIPGGNGQILQVIAVPEPATLGLAAMAGLFLLRRRRRA